MSELRERKIKSHNILCIRVLTYTKCSAILWVLLIYVRAPEIDKGVSRWDRDWAVLREDYLPLHT